eukprot:2993146-Amphidinium_carterae.1
MKIIRSEPQTLLTGAVDSVRRAVYVGTHESLRDVQDGTYLRVDSPLCRSSNSSIGSKNSRWDCSSHVQTFG